MFIHSELFAVLLTAVVRRIQQAIDEEGCGAVFAAANFPQD